MKDKILTLLRTYKTELRYLIIGGCTTLVNFVVYICCRDVFHLHYILGNVIAWVLSVLFAYVANRIWVFESRNPNILKEALLFYSSRLFSGGVEFVLLFISVDLLKINDMWAKIFISIIVVILNYITGKLMVFRKAKEEK